MNRMVESGKTLLVDGPASVSVISGKVEIFGFLLGNNRRRVVVREGKRLPFAVKKEAKLDISVGESASLEEVDEETTPSSWVKGLEELLNPSVRPFIAMVIGDVDSGKTSFCTFLINKLLAEGEKVAILDGDLGQSDVGPPSTISYAFVKQPITDLFNLRAIGAFFVGSTSPSVAIDKVIEGLVSLKREILNDNPDFMIVNTDGWVEGEDAVNYKCQLVEKFNPNVVFCLKQEDEVASLIKNLEGFRKAVVDSPLAIRQRGKEKRRSLRELAYIKYLRNSKVRSIPLSWLEIEGNGLIGLGNNHGNIKQAGKIYELLEMKPFHLAEVQDKICIVIGKRRWIAPDRVRMIEEITNKKVAVVHKGEEEGLLMALYDNEREWLGIGLLQEIDYRRKVMKIYTPVSDKISAVELGRIKLDENFKETPLFTKEV